MEDNNLTFDKKKHLLYSKDAKRIILKHLHMNFPEDEESLWNEIQLKYIEFLETAPYIGGKKNMQAQPVYDCYSLFAYYEVVPVKPTMAELEDMNSELFLTQTEKRRFINLNNPIFIRLANTVFTLLSKNIRKHENEYEDNYIMEVLPFDKNEGIRYKFHRCPIAEFAKVHGHTDIMAPFCNPDYPLIEVMHGKLIRTTTCANGAFCDYTIVGDKSPKIQNHPEYKDENGFVRNR